LLQRFLQTFSEVHKPLFERVCKPSGLKMGVKTPANLGDSLADLPAAAVRKCGEGFASSSTNPGFIVAPRHSACANARHGSL